MRKSRVRIPFPALLRYNLYILILNQVPTSGIFFMSEKINRSNSKSKDISGLPYCSPVNRKVIMRNLKKSIIILLLILITAISAYYFMDSDPPDTAAGSNLEIDYIDVGQGDCVLIESDGKYMLIDAGKAGETDTVINHLRKKGVKKLEYAIWTHPDADHIGGAAEVIKTFQIGSVLMPDKTHTTKTFENLLLAMKDKGLRITRPKVGDTYFIGKASFIILSHGREYEDNNNSSIAIKLTNGNNAFLFIGDTEKEALEDILGNGISLKSVIYMAGHHGSDTSTTKELLQAVNPDYAVISVGKDNSYGHPADSTLQMLIENGTQIYRTDENGTITAFSDGKKITIDAAAYDYRASYTSIEKEGPAEITVYITKSGRKYHTADCSYVSSGKTVIILKEADARRLTPCTVCNPPE